MRGVLAREDVRGVLTEDARGIFMREGVRCSYRGSKGCCVIVRECEKCC